MSNLKTAHSVIGWVFLLVFLVSGGYMITGFPELYQGREEIRMMYRATHIYILMSALLNLTCALAGRQQLPLGFAWVSNVASVLIMIAPVLFTIAFVIEPPAYAIERPISFWGVVALFAGVLIRVILINPWLQQKLQKAPQDENS